MTFKYKFQDLRVIILVLILLQVGLPAKSGVSGALMLVVPNVMGICLWYFYWIIFSRFIHFGSYSQSKIIFFWLFARSPPLDEMGNSVRGVQFCEQFVKMYNFYGVKLKTTKIDFLQKLPVT